ncbi:MAG: S9 family peptidase [Candidatus Thorarchaeota archaeon]
MIISTAEKKPHEYEIHGRKIVDNYYWLKHKGTDEVVKYLEEENAYTIEMTAHTKEFQETLFQEMKDRIKETDETVPIRCGDYFYYTRVEEGKNYRIHCRKHKSLDADEEIILDENKLAEGKKYLNIGSMKVSSNQQLLAYTADFTGGETYELHILDISSGDRIDKLVNVSLQLEWDNDNTSLFYTELDKIHRPYAVSQHILGTKQPEDSRILEEDDTTFIVFLEKTMDQSHILFNITSYAGETIEVHTIDLSNADRTPKLFFSRNIERELIIEHHNGFFYILSNHQDPYFYRLYKTKNSVSNIEEWESVSNHHFDSNLPDLLAFRNHLVLRSRKDGYSNLTVFDIESGEMHEIEMPESIYYIGLSYYTISQVFYYKNPEFNTDMFRFYFSSSVTPKSVYEYNMKSRILELRKVDEIKNHDPGQYVTERRYAKAKDGTEIPISLAYRKDLKMNGKVPLLLYGYGSYGLSAGPDFVHQYLSILERGMILAYAHVRGGGELGKRWYHSGKLEHKMNTFTDFIACAEYLIAEKFTNPEKLCAIGESAGGLLMGAIANLRPDLFKCIYASVPFIDVITTMLDESIPLTTFEYNEWGNPSKKEEFEWMIEYSPYDNVEAKDYPMMLIKAGYNDPRVAYWEPAKWTAKLRDLKTDNNRLLLKTKMETGHLSASGRYDHMKDFAFNWAFILDAMGLADT